MNPKLCAVALALAMPALAEGGPRPAPHATSSRITGGLRAVPPHLDPLSSGAHTARATFLSSSVLLATAAAVLSSAF